MNERIKNFYDQVGLDFENFQRVTVTKGDMEKFAELIVEETLKQVDERVYGRSENQWYYEVDKNWIRLHFGYGELTK